MWEILHVGLAVNSKSTKHIQGYIPAFDYHIVKMDNYFVSMYGTSFKFTSSMVLLDKQHFTDHPNHYPPPSVLSVLHRKP